ncbi:MAG TPA: hypothetical protein DCW97_02685 [Acidobacteria bacterium]|nr:hypothetical protein [Acidobacteriota bacterium]
MANLRYNPDIDLFRLARSPAKQRKYSQAEGRDRYDKNPEPLDIFHLLSYYLLDFFAQANRYHSPSLSIEPVRAQYINVTFNHLRDLPITSHIEIPIFIGLIGNVIHLEGSLEFVL